MRALLRSTIWFFVFLISVSAISVRAQTEYFPKGALSENEVGDRFHREWYSKHLKAMKEPSLLELSKDTEIQVYRFLWLPAFGAPIAVRILVKQDGSGTLITKILGSGEGAGAEKLVTDKQRDLSRKEVARFLRALEEVEFWKTPSISPLPANEIGCDGEEWITEGLKSGKYHVVDRWSPHKSRDRALGELLLHDLAKLNLLK